MEVAPARRPDDGVSGKRNERRGPSFAPAPFAFPRCRKGRSVRVGLSLRFVLFLRHLQERLAQNWYPKLFLNKWMSHSPIAWQGHSLQEAGVGG